jgi:hypothetical protein
LKRYLLAALALPPLALYPFIAGGAAPGPAAEPAAPRPVAPRDAGDHPSPLGVNLAALHYWSGQMVFADLFRQASRWYREDLTTWAWDSGPPLALDEHGWVASLQPNQAASVLIARGPNALLPEGLYELRYDGQGTLTATANAKVVASAPGRLTLEVAQSTTAGIQLRLMATNAADPLRNIRLYPPGIDPDAAPTFHPQFLELLANFRAIRFMDWQRTNGSTVDEWSDRTLPTDAVQTGETGVALEYMLELVNTLDCDAWFCMPHLATDAYVVAFAEAVRSRLEPGRRVFVEYSNELWNGGFTQAAYAAAQGATLGLSGSAFQNQLRFGSRRAVEMFALWRRVFASDPSRVVCVLAGQSVNPWTGQVILDFEDAFRSADAYAIAPYFGGRLGSPQEAPAVLALTPEEWEARLWDDIEDTFTAIAENVALAEERGLPLVAYEGGQHLVGTGGMQENAALTQLFVETNRSAVMGALYERYLAEWRASGAHEMFLWNLADEPSKFGSWGLLERSTQPPAQSPKFRSVTAFTRANEPWW